MSTTIRPITREQFGNKSWVSYSDYRFAATTTVAPLAGPEISKAVSAFPMAFMQMDGKWSLVAVLGLMPGQNLYVAPNGQWATGYIPAVFRSYPFRLAWTQDGEQLLCIDEASGLVAEAGVGQAFFDEAGAPSEAIRQTLGFVIQTAQSREVVSRACVALVQNFVLEPWPLTVQDGEQERQVTGLHRINEAALNKISDEAFIALRQAGALPIAYAQLLSMGNLDNLGKLAQAHAQYHTHAQAATQPLDLDQTFGLADSETVDWTAIKWDD